MYAVFEDGSRQYRVSEGDVVNVDFRDVEPGSRLEFERVLLYQAAKDSQIGQPVVSGAKVVGEVVDHPTVKHYIQKFRRRKGYRRLRGHRQPFTAVRIRSILLPGQAPSAEAKSKPTETPKPAEQPPASSPSSK
jgi:large subunit ribosomal protein L21